MLVKYSEKHNFISNINNIDSTLKTGGVKQEYREKIKAFKYCKKCNINYEVNKSNFYFYKNGTIKCKVCEKTRNLKRIEVVKSKRKELNILKGRDKNYRSHFIKQGKRYCCKCNNIYPLTKEYFHTRSLSQIPSKRFHNVCRICRPKCDWLRINPGKTEIDYLNRKQKGIIKKLKDKKVHIPKIMLWTLFNYPKILEQFEADWSEDSPYYKKGLLGFLKNNYKNIYNHYCQEQTRQKYYSNIGYQRSRVKLYKYSNPDKLKNWYDKRYRLISKNNDKTVSKHFLISLLNKSNNCAYCNIKFNNDTEKSIDHIIPMSKGGQHSINNLIVCCKKCNSTKRAKSIDEFLKYNNNRNNIIGIIEKIKKQNLQMSLQI